MGQDYYNILQLHRDVTDAEIKKAYRKLALKYHPVKSKELGADQKFRQIAEAYDVLSDSERRAVYDNFGEEGLKGGVPTVYGEGFTKGYIYHGDPERTFKEFFGGDNPFSELFDVTQQDIDLGFGGLHGRGRKKQDPAIERELYLTLEEIYRGCTKKMKISRRVMNEDGHTSSIRDKILTINVRPGWKSGTKVTFQKEGDQGPNCIPSDIVFIIKDKDHPLFRRDGTDLIHTAQIPLGKALTGCIVDVPTLDGRMLSIPINDIVYPGYTKRVHGEGMPSSKAQDERGDLIIAFNIEFPKHLEPGQKQLLAQALL